MASLPPWDPTQPLDKSFLAFGDGIHSSRTAVAHSNWSSGKRLMNYDWTLLQTLVFIITPYFVMLALASKDEDDNGPPDGGLMTPAFQGAGT